MTGRSALIGNLLLVLAFGALFIAMLAVLRPFLPALVWAGIIVIATWPLLRQLEAWCGGRRTLAITVMTTALLVLIVGPVTLLLSTLVTRVGQIKELATQWLAGPLPGPPAWLARLPFGAELASEWQQIMARTPEAWAELARPYASRVAQWIAAHVGNIGGLAVEFLLTMVLIVVLYRHGEAVAALLRKIAYRIAGTRGEQSVTLAAAATGAIAVGVVVTALVQALLAGTGLWAAGIPGAALLTSLVFLLCIVQVGPLPILVPAVLWLLYREQLPAGIALGVWAVALSVGDNFLRSWLIQRGARMSFLLIFAGVIGGLMAFGMVGIFIGPIVLSVGLRLLDDWLDDARAASAGANDRDFS